LVLRLYGLSDKPLWYDEIVTLNRANLPLAELVCESAPKWDPFSSSDKHLISARKFVRGRVPVGADRDPCWWRAFSVRSATYAEISRGFHFGADSHPKRSTSLRATSTL
jgi:hypothetical protein